MSDTTLETALVGLMKALEDLGRVIPASSNPNQSSAAAPSTPAGMTMSEVLKSLAPPPGPRYTYLQDHGWHPSHSSFATHIEPSSSWGHAFDITETPSYYLIITDAPGLDPSDIHVRIDPKNHDHLIVQGDRPKLPVLLPDPAAPPGSPPPRDAEVWRNERPRLKFYRTFILPINADVNNIHAYLDKGILTVRVPKIKDVNLPQEHIKRVHVTEGIWKP